MNIGEIIAQILLALFKAVSENGEHVEEFIRFLKIQKGNDLRAEKMDSITRSMRYARETGDTSQLEIAVRNYCNDGNFKPLN